MNLTKHDILELRRRFSKNDCSFTRMSGCYVGDHQNIILKFSQPFLDLEEEVFYKYLEIAKKVLSGTPGGNLLELEIQTNENRQFLDLLRHSKLKNDELLDHLYEKIIASYSGASNYLIILFHDIYDVPHRAQDHTDLEESQQIYEYILCAICPVELSKPGLSYLEDHNCFGPRVRDWVVHLPEIGFVYPAFCNRSTDLNAVMYYVKPRKDSQPDLMQQVLGCAVQRTAQEEKSIFHDLIEQTCGTDDAQDILIDIHKNLQELVATRDQDGLPPIALSVNGVRDILCDVQASDTIKEQLAQTYENTFTDTFPYAQNLLDNKLAAIGVQRQATRALTDKIQSLEQELEVARSEQPAQTADHQASENASSIMVQLSSDKIDYVQSKVIDGQKCLIIPVEDGESTYINGIVTSL